MKKNNYKLPSEAIDFVVKRQNRRFFNKIANLDSDNIKEIIIEQINDLCENNYDKGYEDGIVKGVEMVSNYIDLLYSTKQPKDILQKVKSFLKEIKYEY